MVLVFKRIRQFPSRFLHCWGGREDLRWSCWWWPDGWCGHDGKKLFKTGNQRKLRNIENSRAYLEHNVFKDETAVVTFSKKKKMVDLRVISCLR